MTASRATLPGGMIFPPLTTPGCVSAPIEREVSPHELILGSSRYGARMKMHFLAMQMLADGSSLGDKVTVLDPKGGESTETTVGRLLFS